jgi:hypothetical protein
MKTTVIIKLIEEIPTLPINVSKIIPENIAKIKGFFKNLELKTVRIKNINRKFGTTSIFKNFFQIV